MSFFRKLKQTVWFVQHIDGQIADINRLREQAERKLKEVEETHEKAITLAVDANRLADQILFDREQFTLRAGQLTLVMNRTSTLMAQTSQIERRLKAMEGKCQKLH